MAKGLGNPNSDLTEPHLENKLLGLHKLNSLGWAFISADLCEKMPASTA